MTWRDHAACLGVDPELFFPIGHNGPALVRTEEAKAVCRRCEVVEACLKWAIESGQDTGVWGGLSEDERRALTRRNTRDRRTGGCPTSLTDSLDLIPGRQKAMDGDMPSTMRLFAAAWPGLPSTSGRFGPA